MVEQRIAAVLGRSRRTRGVVVGAEREAVGAGDAGAQQQLDRRAPPGAGRRRSRRRAAIGSCGEASAIPAMPASVQPWKTARVLGDARSAGRPRRARRGRRRPRRGRRRAARRARRERRAQLDQRQHPALRGRRRPRPARRRQRLVRPRFVAECSQPCGPAKSTSLRAASAGVEALARLLVEQLPARVGDRRELAQEVVHRSAPLQAADAERAASVPGERRRRARRRRLRSSPPRPPRRARRCRPAGRGRPAAISRQTACGAAGTRGPC